MGEASGYYQARICFLPRYVRTTEVPMRFWFLYSARNYSDNIEKAIEHICEIFLFDRKCSASIKSDVPCIKFTHEVMNEFGHSYQVDPCASTYYARTK